MSVHKRKCSSLERCVDNILMTYDIRCIFFLLLVTFLFLFVFVKRKRRMRDTLGKKILFSWNNKSRKKVQACCSKKLVHCSLYTSCTYFKAFIYSRVATHKVLLTHQHHHHHANKQEYLTLLFFLVLFYFVLLLSFTAH